MKASSNSPVARLLTIGDEILIGQITDTNSAYIAQKFNEIGLSIEEIISIGDAEKIIIDALEKYSRTSDILITTGGLGPTKDDITKKALSRFLGKELIRDEEVLKELEIRFKNRGLSFNSLNQDQALVPEGSTVLKNPLGSAPGIWSEKNDCIIINLQGVPFEMKNLIKTEVIPLLRARFSLPFKIHRHLTVANYPESELALTLAEWENNLPPGFGLAYLPERGRVKLRISVTGEDRDLMASRIETEVKKLKEILGKDLVSTVNDRPEMILGEKLREKNKTISTAESCTGGSIARMITSVPGSSEYYKGSVVSYATSVKEEVLGVAKELIQKHTVVSREVAEAMALGACKKLKTDYAVATTGVAGPAKGEDGKEVGTVWISVTDGQRFESKMYFLPYLEREEFIDRTSRLALQNSVLFIGESK